MTLLALRAALAARVKTASVRQVHDRPPDRLGATPAVVIGAITWEVRPGERELAIYRVDLEIWVERTRSDAEAIRQAETVAEELRDALAADVDLGATVSHAFIVGGAANDWITSGVAEYCVLSLTVEATTRQLRGYSP